MAYTTVDKVRGILGEDFTEEEIQQAIEDAAAIVAPLRLSLFGQNTDVEENKLIDSTARFTARVQVGAKVWVRYNGELLEATVTQVDSDIALTLDADIFTLTGMDYEIEDIAWRELAERYKAASLLVSKRRGERSHQVAPGERVTLGPATVAATGSLSETLVAVGDNPYEQRFREIVGTTLF